MNGQTFCTVERLAAGRISVWSAERAIALYFNEYFIGL
jgi:hypothetical protein